MYRATRRRGEDVPTVPDQDAAPASVESLLAISLCAVVLLASVALLRRRSDYTRVLEAIQKESVRERGQRPRPQRAQPEAEQRPDLVLLLMLDGLRADRLGLYGHERETAPYLHALADEGVVFHTVAAQASWPLASHKSLLTGKYPTTLFLERTGADALELAHERRPSEFLTRVLGEVEGTLAQRLQEAGYRTAAFTAGGDLRRGTGFERGFQTFDDGGGGLKASGARALSWLEQDSPAPAFLYLQVSDLACPYPAPEPLIEAFCADHSAHGDLARFGVVAPDDGTPAADRAALADHYDAAVRAQDEALGAFLQELRARDLFDRALILVTSAHGEGLGEHDVVGHGALYPEMLLVPLVLKPPSDWSPSPPAIEDRVELVDLLPTLVALCARNPERDLDGHSLLPTLRRGVHGRDVLVAQTSFASAPGLRANPSLRTLLRPGRWQLIEDGAHAEASLLTLDPDPLGPTARPVTAEEFGPLLDVLLQRERAPEPGSRSARVVAGTDEHVPIAPALEEALLQLGYGAAGLAGPDESSGLR